MTALALLATIGMALYCSRPLPRRYQTAPPPHSLPGDETLAAISDIVASGWQGRPVPAVATLNHPGTALLLAYRQGLLLSRRWSYGDTWAQSLHQTARRVALDCGPEQAPEALYVCLGYNYRTTRISEISDDLRGEVGLEIAGEAGVEALFPVEALNADINYGGWLRQRLWKEPLRRFEALQYLLKPARGGHYQCQRLIRGRLPGKVDLNQALVQQMYDSLRESLLTYAQTRNSIYIPRADVVLEYPPKAPSLTSTPAKFRPVRDHHRASDLSLRTLAVADLTNSDSNTREMLDSEWRPTGQFGSATDDPGLALQAWAKRYQSNHDPRLLQRFLLSFHFYREQVGPDGGQQTSTECALAYALMARASHNAELEQAVYELHDQWIKADGASPALTMALYVQSLGEAFALARERRQSARMHNYRRALQQAVLRLRAVQYSAQDELSYLTPPARKRVLGGMRVAPWNQKLEGETQQQVLAALGKILDEFAPSDYAQDREKP